MSILDLPFIVRYRAPIPDPGVGSQHVLFVADEALGPLPQPMPAPNLPLDIMPLAGDGGHRHEICVAEIAPTEQKLLRWIELACRQRGLFLDPDVLFELAQRSLEQDGDAIAARALIEHVVSWSRLEVRAPDFDPVSANLIPTRLSTAAAPPPTPWAAEPWRYRDGRLARRDNPRDLPLHAPEFDYSWSDEFRSVLLSAPPQRPYNAVPLLAVFVRPWSYPAAFWDWEIFRILQSFPEKAPKDLLELDDWYPPHPARPHPLSDLTEWTSQRLLDGFCGLPLQREPGADGDRYLIEIDWSDIAALSWQELPNVTVVWEQRDGACSLVRVDIAERRLRWKATSLPQDWRSHPDKYFHLRSVAPEDGERLWQHALFVARSAALMAGEVDVHLARAHLLIEAYAMMMEVHGNGPVLAPVKSLLAPFLRDVTGINRLGDALVLGGNGVLCEGTGLSESMLATRLANQVAFTDWKGFSPRDQHPILADARYPVAAQAFWAGIGTLVDEWLGAVPAADRGALVAALSAAVGAHNDHFPDEPGRVMTARPGAELVWPAEWARQVDADGSRISRPTTFAEVGQLCRYVIFHAVFVHGWVNDEAWIDGGSLQHAVFSLSDLDPPRRGQSWQEWFRQSGPTRESAALQLSVGWTLDRVGWGRIGDPSDLASSEAWDKARYGERAVCSALQAAMRVGSPSPESELARIGRPLSSWRIRINS